ncbi:uncharacterized protein BCR38DRAFT_428669 [Pseudomassariella vexata]|uniref:DUF202 domain-containing protein n=1 Tax=Pseudomassariella vexata TaxID=1141098 RepID=A0A1Y2E370_9PEZI|nr:uncharacterized protein BCR38DRAFT_428669 [Pseudomassariella vexata]ORY65897.1 hypothetical protein BCR38DRAFT_428669 [Pseudomassariella vexata]
MATDTSSHPTSPEVPTLILRRPSSQSQPNTRPPSFAGLPRRQLSSQSAQERINDILETGRERADAMPASPWSSGRSHSFQPLSQAPEQDDSPDETTGLVMRGSSRNYQSTHRTSNSRSQPSPTRAQGDSQHANGVDGTSGADKKETYWWTEYFSSIWTIELENKGSVARDHLALERTFLAWLRTSLAFASIGIAITQLFRLNVSLTDSPEDPNFRTIRHLGKPLGATFLGISILVLFLGYHRYFESQQWILKGKFPSARGTIVVMSLIAFALMAVLLVVVVVEQPAGSQDSP